MGLIALPVSREGLSLRGDDEADAGDTGDEGSGTNMSAFAKLIAALVQLQQFLNVPVTGQLDEATQNAVKSVQWAHNLPQTGNPLDPATKAVLEQAGADLSSLTTADYIKITLYSYWTRYKWWIVGGGAVVVGGGALLWASRRKGR